MTWLIHIAMGIALAACAGLRAWLPLLIVGVLGRLGYLELQDGFTFLTSNGALLVLVTATVVEIIGDKVPTIDHLLDGIGTVLRPAAGTVLAASMFVNLDPLTALLLGLLAGGTTALTVHTWKAVVRTGVSALFPVHFGLGNTVLSLAEDALTAIAVALILFIPVIALLVAVVGTVLVVRFVYRRVVPVRS